MAEPLLFEDEARQRILRGIETLARAVCVTLGPRGRTVILEREGGAPRIVNSGVLVARAVELEDRFENMGAQLLREVASRTSELAGDGTTTATVLAHAMVREGMRYLAGGFNAMDMRRGMEEAIAAVVAELARLARPCAGPVEIAHVAAISANNDRSIGDLIARAIDRVGRDGAVSIEDGSGLDSLLEVTEGLQFDRGFLSPYFVNDGERHSARLDEAAVLVVDGRLTTLKELLPVLEDVVKERRPLLVIAEDIVDEALAALVINTVQGTLRACAVKAPGFGDQRRALLQDIAVLTGAQLVSAERGLPLHQTRLSHLGRVRKVEVTRSDTTLVGGAGSAEAIAERVSSLKAERGRVQREHEREALDSRIARLCGGVAVIKVGAATETELKERKIRVEDALHATRAAIAEGVVPGGGVALVRARQVLRGLVAPNLDHDAGLRIVERALEEPLRRLVLNAGEEPSVVLDQVRQAASPSYGYNAATRSFGDLLQMGVIDPAKVTRLGLQNAGSIAALVLTTDCVVSGPAASQLVPGAVA